MNRWTRSTRTLVLAILVGHAIACGGGPAKQALRAQPAVADGFSAARWVPAKPTFLIAARSVRDLQRSLRDAIDVIGPPLGEVDAKLAGQLLTTILRVDPLDPDALARIGIDVDGGIVAFSEGLDPTFVAHLSAADATQAFFDEQRKQGLVTQSVFVDGAEVFTARLVGDTTVSWAIDKDWMWVHFDLKLGREEGAAWFAHSHAPEAATWTDRWAWAAKMGPLGTGASSGGAKQSSVLGFVELKTILELGTNAGSTSRTCASMFGAAKTVGLALDGDLKQAGARVSFELESGDGIRQHLIAPPPGWAALAQASPLAAEVDLDLQALEQFVQPCLAAFGVEPRFASSIGIRAGRALVKSLDPDERKTWAGAMAFDVTSPAYFAKQLDSVLDFPGRSFLEKSKQFGPYKGRRLSAPTFPALEWVLADQIVVLAVSDGLIEKLVTGPAAPAAPPLVAVDLRPQGLSVGAWAWLFTQAGIEHAQFLAEHLQAWREAHVRLALDGNALVLEARGVRR